MTKQSATDKAASMQVQNDFPDNPKLALAAIKKYCQLHDIGPITICDMDYERRLLTGANDHTYFEIETNLWFDTNDRFADVAYLGTGKHQGGIVLRPIYVLVCGAWRNTTTGALAPDGMPMKAKNSRFVR